MNYRITTFTFAPKLEEILLKGAMNWYEIWFNSPYYHMLYSNHDEQEAATLVNNITKKIQIPKQSKVLDLACGSGRFSYQLFLHQFQTVGMDIAARSIAEAKEKYGHAPIKFIEHDMLQNFPEKDFSVIFNFFTSFGYFGQIEMLLVLKNMRNALLDNGLIFIDYLNVKKITKDLPKNLCIKKENIEFHISKKHEGDYILKHIEVKDRLQSIQRHFEEKVYYLTLSSFEDLLSRSQLKIVDIFGDYELNGFSEKESDRLIVVAKKYTHNHYASTSHLTPS